MTTAETTLRGNQLPAALRGSVLCGRVSIIMLQKVAAIIKKVAADLCYKPSKVRWLLQRKIFAIAATFAAN